MHVFIPVALGVLVLVLIVIVAGVLRNKHIAKVRAEEARKALEARKTSKAKHDPYRSSTGSPRGKRSSRSAGGHTRTKNDSSGTDSTLYAAGILGASDYDTDRHHGSGWFGNHDSGSFGSHDSGSYGGSDSGGSSSFDSGGGFSDSSSF